MRNRGRCTNLQECTHSWCVPAYHAKKKKRLTTADTCSSKSNVGSSTLSLPHISRWRRGLGWQGGKWGGGCVAGIRKLLRSPCHGGVFLQDPPPQPNSECKSGETCREEKMNEGVVSSPHIYWVTCKWSPKTDALSLSLAHTQKCTRMHTHVHKKKTMQNTPHNNYGNSTTQASHLKKKAGREGLRLWHV